MIAPWLMVFLARIMTENLSGSVNGKHFKTERGKVHVHETRVNVASFSFSVYFCKSCCLFLAKIFFTKKVASKGLYK